MFAVHVIGEVAGALGFSRGRLYAHYKMVCNTEHWHVMQGMEEGYTHVDETSVSRAMNGVSSRVFSTSLSCQVLAKNIALRVEPRYLLVIQFAFGKSRVRGRG